MNSQNFSSKLEEVSSSRYFREMLIDIVGPNGHYLLTDVHRFITEKYSQKDRYYHNFGHISNCLLYQYLYWGKVDTLCLPSEYPAIFTAIYFHDIVYVPGRDDNEERSALVAETILNLLGCRDIFIKKVKELIIITKHGSKTPSNNEEMFMADIDILNLSNSWEEFCIDTEAICNEFKNVCSRNDFLIGQKKYLAGKIFGREHVYYCAFFREACQKKARSNFYRFLKYT